MKFLIFAIMFAFLFLAFDLVSYLCKFSIMDTMAFYAAIFLSVLYLKWKCKR